MEMYIRLVGNRPPRRNRMRITSSPPHLSSPHRDAALAQLHLGLRRFPLLVDDVECGPEGDGGILCTMPDGLITEVALGEFRTVADEAIAHVERHGLTED